MYSTTMGILCSLISITKSAWSYCKNLITAQFQSQYHDNNLFVKQQAQSYFLTLGAFSNE